MTEAEGGGGLPHLAERLNLLFTTVPREVGSKQPYTIEQAAEEITAAGVPVTGRYLNQLRSGNRDNPSARLLGAIANLFGVPVSYFFDDEQAARVEAQLEALVAIRDARIQSIVARTKGISDAGIANLDAILNQIRQIEGLRDEDR